MWVNNSELSIPDVLETEGTEPPAGQKAPVRFGWVVGVMVRKTHTHTHTHTYTHTCRPKHMHATVRAHANANTHNNTNTHI